MPPPPAATDYHRASSAVSMAFRGGRSVLSLRRNQVTSIDHHHHHNRHDDNNDDTASHQLDLFQSHVADHLSSLSKLEPLSLPFIHKLLQSFLSSQSEFTNLLSVFKPSSSSSSSSSSSCINLDKPLADLLDRLVKSLDIINELTNTVQSTHDWNRHADIAASALTSAAGEAQLIRAKRALTKLLFVTPSENNPAAAHHQNERRVDRAWTFLSRNNSSSCNHANNNSYSTTKEEKRLSRSWSATKQLSALSANLVGASRGVCYEGVAVAAYTMTWFVVFVMRVLVASFSDTGFVGAPVGLPRMVVWGPSMAELEEKVGEEWRRRRKGRALREVVEVEKYGKGMMEAVERGGEEVVERAAELGEASRRLGKGLGEYEREVRVVFHRILRCREEVMRWVENNRCASGVDPFFAL